MRLFTAIIPSPTALDQLDVLLRQLRPRAPIRWSPVENLHITTKFIGEYPNERLAELLNALRTIRMPEFAVSLGAFQWFPNKRAPRVLSLQVDGGSTLIELADRTETALTALGVAREARVYSPHLTLARIPKPSSSVPLPDYLNLATFPVRHFELFQSEAGRYRMLESFEI